VAVVGRPHEVKGEVPAVFLIPKSDVDVEGQREEIEKKIVDIVRERVGPVATPGAAYFVTDVPKTESGKVIRRFLKGLVKDEELGDMTTASNPESLKELAEKVGYEGPEDLTSITT